MKAYWNNQLIAESNNTIVIEGNHYFPEKSIQQEFFAPSNTHTVCPWKGTASYYHLGWTARKIRMLRGITPTLSQPPGK